MNKAIFGLLFLVTMITCEIKGLNSEYEFKCPDKKLKLGDICALSHTKGTGNAKKNFLYIKKTCGKNKKCTKDSSKDHYQCQSTKSFELLKIGKSCAINEECLSNLCENGICKEIGDCTKDKDCGEGRYCTKGSKEKGKCVEYVEEDQVCNSEPKYRDPPVNEDEKRCSPGLGCIFENDSTSTTTGKCVKYGTIGFGKYVYKNPFFCEKGLPIDNVWNAYCGELISVNECDSGTHKCTYKYKGYKDGKGEQKDDGSKNCYQYGPEGKYLCPYSMEMQTYYNEKIVPRLKKLDYKKLKKDKYYDYLTNYAENNYYKDRKLSEYLQVLKNWNKLLAEGYIDKDGKVNKEKKCEYEFWWSMNFSSYSKIGLSLAYSLVLLFL